jgi:hypothetical protein
MADWFTQVAEEIKGITGKEVYWNTMPTTINASAYFYLENTPLDDTDTSTIEQLDLHLIADTTETTDEDMWNLLAQARTGVANATKTLAFAEIEHTVYMASDLQRKDYMLRLKVVRENEL